MAAYARVKVWVTGDVLTASDLNGEFNVIINALNGGIESDNLATLSTVSFDNATTTDTIRIKSTGGGAGWIVYS